MKQKLDRDLLREYKSLSRTGIHPICGHPILDSRLVGCYSCDNIDCKNCASFTVLHIFLEQTCRDEDRKERVNNLLRKIFPFISKYQKRDVL